MNRRSVHVNITSAYAEQQLRKLWDQLDQKLSEVEVRAVKACISRWQCHERNFKAAGI